MAIKNIGALPMQIIRGLMETDCISHSKENRLSPASLDLAVSEELYLIEQVFLPRPGEPIRNLLKEMVSSPHDLANPLQRGSTYIARLEETFALPSDVYAYANPKSSSGRNDIHARIIADGVSRFDSIPHGFTGGLWLIITPNSFSIKMDPGECLSQIRFFTENTRLSELELRIAIERDKLLWNLQGSPIHYDNINISDRDGSVIITVDISEKFIGWESIPKNNTLNLSKKWHHMPEEFFRPIRSTNGHIHLKQGNFYILRSKEAIRVPPYLACEIAPVDERAGEFRSHYAGFFDPGWGWGLKGEGIGRPAVFEVRPLFQDLALRDNQPIAKFKFEHLARLPEKAYDQFSTSHYTNQSATAMLSKHFVPQQEKN